jgi:hypothetical protein
MDQKKKLESLLSKVFDSCREGLAQELSKAEYEQRRHDFVFHMTDWVTDLFEYADLVKHPEKHKKDEASEFLIGFLYHVVPHLNAAGRLLLDEIKDPFAGEPAHPVAPNAGKAV